MRSNRRAIYLSSPEIFPTRWTTAEVPDGPSWWVYPLTNICLPACSYASRIAMPRTSRIFFAARPEDRFPPAISAC